MSRVTRHPTAGPSAASIAPAVLRKSPAETRGRRQLDDRMEHSSAPAFDLQRHQSCEQGRRVELADDRFQVAEAACDGMHRKDVAITRGGQGDEAEVDYVAGERRVIFKFHA